MSKNLDKRSVNFSRNALYSMIAELVIALLSFISRFFFVKHLSTEYLGLNGLFSNILVLLSLAELGAGSAIVYSLYKPIAENDVEKINSFMKLYKNIYFVVGIAIIVLGVSLIPFLDSFIKERPAIDNGEFILIYILTIIQTASTYFFCYRYSLYSASQQGYIIQKYNMFFAVIRTLLQIMVLITLHNYVVYLIVAIVTNLIFNGLLSQKVTKEYPFLKNKAKNLDADDSKIIKKNIFSMLLYKAGITVSTTIDTMLISKYFGLATVGLYSNYHLIISYSDKLFSTVLGTITPSLGNLMVSDSDDRKKLVFLTLQLIYYWLATFLAVGLIVLFNPLIKLLFGEGYLLDQSFVVCLVISITLTNFQRPCGLMRDATGLFWYGKLRPVAMSILNIVFSVILIKYVGVIGVVIGTIIAKCLTYVWYDPYIVFKHALGSGLAKYFIRYICHWILLAILAIICNLLYSALNISGFLGLIIGAFIITVVVNGVFFALFRKSDQFQYVHTMVKPIVTKILLKKK